MNVFYIYMYAFSDVLL